MSIDPSTIKPGGRVSVTLTDGTKIIDSPVGQSAGTPALFFGDLAAQIITVDGALDFRIASIDAYTPPTLEWDRPEVFAVKDADGDAWCRIDNAGVWTHEGFASKDSDGLEAKYGPCTVLAVYADGAER